MLVSDAFAQIRTKLRDPVVSNPPAARPYSDGEVMASIDTMHLAMFRKLVEADANYHNFPLALQAEDAREISKGTFQWSLNSWVDNVIDVRERLMGSTQEVTSSPYLWAFANQTQLGQAYPRFSSTEPRGWSWEGMHTFRLHGQSIAPDLTLNVAKTPPRMWKIAVATDSLNASMLFLPPTFALGQADLDVGAAINAEVQCVGTTSQQSKNQGIVRRVIHSDAASILETGRAHVLYFEQPWPDAIKSGDTFETRLPIPDKHANYLILKVTAGCAQKNNSEVLKAIGPELSFEAAEYDRFATPRDPNVGAHWRSVDTGSSPPPYDPNFDNSYAWGF
jgi:hypothetical protein